MDRDLDGRVAIVTGGGRGMGAAHVRALIDAGACVLCGDILDDGETLISELPQGRAMFERLDVTSRADWQRAVEAVEKQFGPVSVLVNNAGIFAMGPIEEMEEASFRRVLDTNTVGTFLGMQAVIGSMRRAGGGSIINISSTAGFAGSPQMAAYVASKFAVRGMTKVAALEFAKDKVRVNSIHPGAIATPMTAGAGPPDAIPIPRFAAPEEVAKLMLYLASEDSAYCTGGEFTIDGGLLCVVGQNTMDG